MKMLTQLKTLSLPLILLAMGAPAMLRAQAVYGGISGNVIDQSGAAVPHAKVTITDTTKGINYSTLTNESGNYSQTHLIVGTYQIRIDANGFTSYLNPA